MAPRLTHLALPCHDLDATIAWYEKHTPLRKTHHRQDALGALLRPENLKKPLPTVNNLFVLPPVLQFERLVHQDACQEISIINEAYSAAPSEKDDGEDGSRVHESETCSL